jgi:hypothetical protein
MGWTRDKYRGVEIEVGDEPLGVVLHLIEEFSRCYRNDIERRPQLLELVHALDRALTYEETRWLFEDLQTKEVVGIKVSTKNAPRRQKLQTGDYFAIPLLDRGYAYGRVLLTKSNNDQLLEFYRLQTEDLKSLAELERKSLRPLTWKHAYTTKALTSRGWVVLGNRPIPNDFEYPPFYLGARETAFQTSRGGRVTTATEAEARQLEPIITYSPEQIEERLASHGGRRWPEVKEVRRRDFPAKVPSEQTKLRTGQVKKRVPRGTRRKSK